jgi:uncharacterized RDD family membrane protein YckC
LFHACYGQPRSRRIWGMTDEHNSPATGWPGKRLGLPDSGPRSVGRLGRRIGAIAIDWAVAVIISVAFFHYDSWATLTIFAIEQILFVSLLSGSIGQLILGLRVVPLRSGWVGVWRPALRTVLLCIVIPAVIWDKDQRGVHDRLAGTVLVRR